MLNILPNRLQTNVIRPISAEKTEVIFNYFYTNPDEMGGMIKEDMEYSHDIQMEDIEICELVQKGLKSKAYHKGRFSVQRENGVYHFQTLLKKVLGSYADRDLSR
jgi:choline monooxygenase